MAKDILDVARQEAAWKASKKASENEISNTTPIHAGVRRSGDKWHIIIRAPRWLCEDLESDFHASVVQTGISIKMHDNSVAVLSLSPISKE
jgi:hypothetical protein